MTSNTGYSYFMFFTVKNTNILYEGVIQMLGELSKNFRSGKKSPIKHIKSEKNPGGGFSGIYSSWNWKQHHFQKGEAKWVFLFLNANMFAKVKVYTRQMASGYLHKGGLEKVLPTYPLCKNK